MYFFELFGGLKGVTLIALNVYKVCPWKVLSFYNYFP